jgi:hypothetical protein
MTCFVRSQWRFDADGTRTTTQPLKKEGFPMDFLINDFAGGILTAAEPPCLSLYQPTHRHHPDNQ